MDEDLELLQDFRTESLEHLNEIELLFLEIESREGAELLDMVNHIFRAAHSVKGAAGFFGLDRIQDLSHAFGKRYSKILQQAADDSVPLIELEADCLGFTHGEAGAALLGNWGLAEAVVEAAAHHHSPGEAEVEHRLTVQVVHLADWISSQQGLGLVFEGELGHFAEGAWFDLGIEVDVIPDVIADFSRMAQESDLMLALTKS